MALFLISPSCSPAIHSLIYKNHFEFIFRKKTPLIIFQARKKNIFITFERFAHFFFGFFNCDLFFLVFSLINLKDVKDFICDPFIPSHSIAIVSLTYSNVISFRDIKTGQGWCCQSLVFRRALWHLQHRRSPGPEPPVYLLMDFFVTTRKSFETLKLC